MKKLKLSSDAGFNFVFHPRVLAEIEQWNNEEMIIENRGKYIEKIDEDKNEYTFTISDSDCHIVFILPKKALELKDY